MMKYKILATMIAGILLTGCNSDNDNSVTPAEPFRNVMAFDPAIKGMSGSFECTGGEVGNTEKTSHSGITKITHKTVFNKPETCAFTFNPTAGAVDVSNGKDMSKVSYNFPRGLANFEHLVTASPLSTLIFKELDGENYDESTAIEVLKTLGLYDLFNAGGVVSAADFLRRTQAVIEGIEDPDLTSKVLATASILSDVLIVTPDASVSELSAAAEAITKKVIADYPDYPNNTDGDLIYLDLAKDPTFIENVVQNPSAQIVIPDDAEKLAEPVPVDPLDPPTGGTGGTGGGSNGGGTGA